MPTHRTESEPIPVTPAGSKTLAWLFLLVVVLPLALSYAAAHLAGGARHAPDARLIPGITGAAFVVLAYCMRRFSLSLDGGRFKLRSSFYTIDIPLSDLAGGAQVLDLRERSPLRPRLRTNGFSVPGYKSGWYRGADGSRLFAAVTTDRVLYLPTRLGYGILLSVQDAEALQRRLAA